MAIVTTMRTGGPRIKPFAWSFSRMKNFEVCPKRHYEVDLAKSVKEPEGEQLAWGNLVHDGMARRCGLLRVPLPPELVQYEVWAQRALSGVTDSTIVLVEESLAIGRDFSPKTTFEDG